MQIGIDIGGTFTDIVALDRDGRLALTKVPSTPKDLLEGIGPAARVRGSRLHFCVLIQLHRIASSRDERSQSPYFQICL